MNPHPLVVQATAYVANRMNPDESVGLVVALLARIADLDSQLEAKDRLNAELCARIQGRRTTPIIPDPYIAAKTAPRGEM
jgi:hypothetical protein